MIKNLPHEFPIEKLRDFDFGSAEAKEDGLLLDCPCHLKSIDEFLSGKKDIVLGERGAGKSALLRLITVGSLQFANPGKRKQVIVPIEEELQYIALKERLLKQIGDESISDEIKFRLIWEIFILYRLIQTLASEFQNEDSIAKLWKDWTVALGVSEKVPTFLKLFLSHKKTIGVKLENVHTGLAIPSVYASMEPSSMASQEKTKDSLFLDVDEYKKKVQFFLRTHSAVAYVLIDKLDEFVVKESYEIQKNMLQGLLACQRSYASTPEIKLKLFLRSDLFLRLNFESLGYDKVISKTVNLSWEPEDIRQLLAKRITFNLFHLLELKELRFEGDDTHLYLRKSALKEANNDVVHERGEKGFLHRVKPVYWWLARKLEMCGLDPRDARRTNFIDEINRQIISIILPRRHNHLTIAGKTEQIDIFKYLETSFTLGGGCATPRVVLSFLQKCIEHTRDYYRRNPDQDKVSLDPNNEYPLILRDCISDAYAELQEQIWETFANVDNTWKKLVLALKAERSCFSDTKIGYRQIVEILSSQVTEEAEIQRFLAFVSHVGLLICYNGQQKYENRAYELPILFQGQKDK